MIDGVLKGIRVLDVAQLIAGPTAAMYLGDAGADVIKVEPPGGETYRYANSHGDPKKRPESFLVINRGKRSLTLDVRDPAGREVYYELVKTADVVICNMRRDAAARHGLGYEALRAINPRLIYAWPTGFGSSGPEAERPAIDLVIQARSGVMARRRMPDGRPVSAPFPVADLSAAILLAYGVTLALLARERTGQGQLVEVSLLQAALAMQATEIVRHDRSTELPGLGYAFYNACACGDGRYIVFATQGERRWRELCQALDIPEIADAPEFATWAQRVQHGDELFAILESVFATRPAREWFERFQAYDVPAEVITPREQLFDDPQVVANEMLVSIPDDYFGRITQLGLPVRLSATPGQVGRPAPGIGEHNAEILAELGLSAERISALRAAGAIG